MALAILDSLMFHLGINSQSVSETRTSGVMADLQTHALYWQTWDLTALYFARCCTRVYCAVFHIINQTR